MNELNPYTHKWQKYRKHRVLAFGLLLGFLPGVAGLGWILSFFTNSETPALTLAIIWMLACGWSGVRLSFFRCPRCGKFFRGWDVGLGRHSYETIVGRKCAHCGLGICENS